MGTYFNRNITCNIVESHGQFEWVAESSSDAANFLLSAFLST